MDWHLFVDESGDVDNPYDDVEICLGPTPQALEWATDGGGEP